MSLSTAAMNQSWESVQVEASQVLGPVRDSLTTVLPMTVLYLLILVTGLIGNVVTCIVIYNCKYMHTATNFYLFSLAVSDLMLLLLGLPQELFMLWQKYPYVFGEFFCLVRGLSSETSTNASILIITAFTVERYVAICHPLKSHTMSQLPRAIKTILVIWAVSAVCALPIGAQFGIISMVDRKGLQNISRVCSLKTVILSYGFEVTAIIFFLVPVSVICILYIRIGINLRRSSNQIKTESSLAPKEMLTQYSEASHSESINLCNQRNSICSNSHQKQIASRRSVIRMLLAVVIAFFFCYSPFHAQRVLASTMNRFSLKSKTYFMYHVVLTHISGVTYYLSSTINPILYQLMSRKFRIAFKDTFGYCLPCFRNALPEITYSNIVGGVSSYKLSRTGSFYSNGSFRRSSLNLATPIANRQPKGSSVALPAESDTSSSGSKPADHSENIQVEEESSGQVLRAEKSAFLNVPSFKF